MGPCVKVGGYAPAPGTYHYTPAVPVVHYGAPPAYGTLSLPAAPVTDDRTASYAAADRQHDAIKAAGTAPDTAERRKPEYQTIEYFNPQTRIYEKNRYFKLDGQDLLEWQPSKESKDGVWVKATGITRYYYADGQLYDESGRSLGRFGINTEAAKELKGKPFLGTWGTLETSRGFVDYSASSLKLGNTTAIIQIGPPPGMVAAYRESTKHIIVDHNYGTFRQIDNDKAYERYWVKPDDLTSGRVKSAKPQWTVEDIKKLPVTTDGSGARYRYAPDGRVRFKDMGSDRFDAEVRVHHTTNWRDSNGTLCTARVGWVSDATVVAPTTLAGPGPGPGPAKVISPSDRAVGPIVGQPKKTPGPIVQAPVDEGREAKKEEKKGEKKEDRRVVVAPPVLPQPEQIPVLPRPKEDPPAVISKKDAPAVVVQGQKPPPEVLPPPPKVVLDQPPPVVLPPPPVMRMAAQDRLVVFDMLQTIMQQKDLVVSIKGATQAPLQADEALLPGGPQARFFAPPLTRQVQGGFILDREAPSMNYDQRVREFIRPTYDEYADGTRKKDTTPLTPLVLKALKEYKEEVMESDKAIRALNRAEKKGTNQLLSAEEVFDQSAVLITGSRMKLENHLGTLARGFPGGAEAFFKELREEADRRFKNDPLTLARYRSELDLLESKVTGRPLPPNAFGPLPLGVLPGPGMPGNGMPGNGMPGNGMPGNGMPGGPPAAPLPLEPAGWMPLPQRHQPGREPVIPRKAIPNPNVQPPRLVAPAPLELIS